MNSEYVLTKYDEVLLLDKGFTYEVFGTMWGKSRDGCSWCCDPSLPGEHLMFAPTTPKAGLLCHFRTMSRETFEELFV